MKIGIQTSNSETKRCRFTLKGILLKKLGTLLYRANVKVKKKIVFLQYLDRKDLVLYAESNFISLRM
jgi:hypothetical protein